MNESNAAASRLYRRITGQSELETTPEPEPETPVIEEVPAEPEHGGGHGKPTSASLKVDIVTWLLDNGSTLTEEELVQFTKTELLELVDATVI